MRLTVEDRKAPWASARFSQLRQKFRALRPFAVASSVLLASCMAGVWWASALASAVAVFSAPIARALGTRVLLAAIGTSCVAGVVGTYGLIPTTRPGVMVLVCILLLLAVITALSAPQTSWRPVSDGSDVLVAVGALAVLLTLTVPMIGMGDERLLMDIAPGFDDVHHFLIMSNLIEEGGRDWASADGSPPVMEGYPVGFHSLGASVILAADGRSAGWPGASLGQYAVVSALVTAWCAAVLGWMAIGIVSTLSMGERRYARVLTGLTFAVAAPLGGFFVSHFGRGHVAFLLPASCVAAGSWLALTPGVRTRERLTVVAATTLVAYTMYPSVAVGTIPAWLVLLGMGWRGAAPARRWLLVGMAGLGVVVCVLSLWRDGWLDAAFLDFVATVSGSVVALPTVILGAVGVLLLLVLIALRAGAAGRPILRALRAPMAFAAFAVLLAVSLAVLGYPTASNYYVWKSANAAWIAAYPVVLAIAGGILSKITGHGLLVGSSLLRRTWTVGLLAIAVGLLIASVPHSYGGSFGQPEGAKAFRQRLDRVVDDPQGASLVAAAKVVGASPDAVVVGSVRTEWIPTDGTASKWVNAIRGVASVSQWTATECLETLDRAEVVGCLRDWLKSSDDGLAIVLTAPDEERFDEFARSEGSRVRLIRLGAAVGSG